MLTHLRHRARIHSWLNYLLLVPLLLSGVPATMHASPTHPSQNTTHATHCQKSVLTSADEKSGVPEQDCCKGGTCICSFLTQTILGNLSLAFENSLSPSRVFVPLPSSQLPTPILSHLLRPPIA